MDDDSVLGFVPRLLTRSLTEGLDKSLVIANPTTLEIPSDGGGPTIRLSLICLRPRPETHANA